MIYYKVIIVGGGPAGSSCAWKLKENGIDCLILDKQQFPRTKLCAGWITPQVIDDLKINLDNYQYGIREFSRFNIHIFDKEITLKVHQYAIRRYEFDNWLLQRSGAVIKRHEVRDIKKDGDYYVIDDQYSCEYLVGSGGTHCPVYRTFFEQINPRAKDRLVVTLEEEFPYEYMDMNCHLWFLRNKLPGYSWYVPKNNGYLNIGIGGFLEKLKASKNDIKNHWQSFTEELERLSLVKGRQFNAKGYSYYIRNSVDSVQIDNIFLIGDAAGLATRDMGEGIGPAVKSGILAAEAITSGKTYPLNSVKKNSFPRYSTFGKLLAAYLFNLKM